MFKYVPQVSQVYTKYRTKNILKTIVDIYRMRSNKYDLIIDTLDIRLSSIIKLVLINATWLLANSGCTNRYGINSSDITLYYKVNPCKQDHISDRLLEFLPLLGINNYDASISLFTESRTAVATFLSRIPLRLAPATKIAQIFSNRRLPQRRSRSSRPEHEYNTDLVRFFITLQGDTPVPLQQPPYLLFDATLTQSLRAQYMTKHNISTESMLIIVHPGTGGSAINFSVEQYAELIKHIAKQINAHF